MKRWHPCGRVSELVLADPVHKAGTRRAAGVMLRGVGPSSIPVRCLWPFVLGHSERAPPQPKPHARSADTTSRKMTRQVHLLLVSPLRHPKEK